MKMPMCHCGHKLSEHSNDDGKLWHKEGFCIVGYYDKGRWLGDESGCPCPEFQWTKGEIRPHRWPHALRELRM